MRRWRTKGADRRAISFHYDVSNDFYALFLDKRMVYTCAYYRQPDGDLDQAQADKLDLVCRKLRLAPGERLLDIGCGWGSLVMWAAERYGVEAHGVTLSAAQPEWATTANRRSAPTTHARRGSGSSGYRRMPSGRGRWSGSASTARGCSTSPLPRCRSRRARSASTRSSRRAPTRRR